jgi:hypothetical protein
MNNNQLALLVKKSEIDHEEKVCSRRTRTAEHFIKNLGKGSDWLVKENLKLLYFYKDFDFVINAVVNLAKENSSDYLKIHINQFLDDSLDVSDLLESQERIRKLTRDRHEAAAGSTEEPKINDHLSLLAVCQKTNTPGFVGNNVSNSYTKSANYSGS